MSMCAAFVQTVTETVSGFWTLVVYLVPAGVALGLVIALMLRQRRRRRRRSTGDDDRD